MAGGYDVDDALSNNPASGSGHYTPNGISSSNSYNQGSKGTITKTIGSGDNAKNSVIWHVISTTFCIFSCIVAAMFVIDVVNNNGRGILQIVKDVWSIFTPILTLSLGYMFGKEETKKDEKT